MVFRVLIKVCLVMAWFVWLVLMVLLVFLVLIVHVSYIGSVTRVDSVVFVDLLVFPRANDYYVAFCFKIIMISWLRVFQ
jgi:hypothetical protein